MKEFIEKLIEKMQGVFCDGCTSCRVNQCDGVDKEECRWMVKIKESINQLAEEYNNEFCEWKYWRTIDDVPMYKSSCIHEFEERFVKKYKFCPYCGKKIKVVE